ncbi:hypothetical protein KAK07_02890 [Ideonella sp. 4Y16]|uniref:hypothetical protein n=1 Tax=Ideonella alba TaxID=2824118 RepID=UPI001B381A4D|nr:hypothetical protein [Ideonella alba]MBQ0942277.1 hypothetical protein [Ideonella alba]
MHKPDSLQQELQRLRQVLQPDSEAFELRQRLHEQHVTAFAEQLHPAVCHALVQEGSAEVAAAWLDDARRALTQWAGLLAEPGQPAPARLPAVDRQLQEELSAVLLSDQEGPSDDEVDEHARELAQLLLSNWFSLLEHALQDANADALALDFDALPMRTLPGAVLNGCEAFALPPRESAKALREFQQGLARAGEVVSLSPTLHLLPAKHGWHVARTRQRAQVLQLQHAQGPATARPGRIQLIQQVLRPWALARPMELLGAQAVARSTLTLAEEERIAANAARHAVAVFHGHSGVLSVTPMPESLMEGIAGQVIADLDALALDQEDGTGAAALVITPEFHVALSAADEVQVQWTDLGSMYRVALYSAGQALCTREQKATVATWTPVPDDEQARALFACGYAAARQALADPDSDWIGQQLCQLDGVEPSEFGDLRAH